MQTAAPEDPQQHPKVHCLINGPLSISHLQTSATSEEMQAVQCSGCALPFRQQHSPTQCLKGFPGSTAALGSTQLSPSSPPSPSPISHILPPPAPVPPPAGPLGAASSGAAWTCAALCCPRPSWASLCNDSTAKQQNSSTSTIPQQNTTEQPCSPDT